MKKLRESADVKIQELQATVDSLDTKQLGTLMYGAHQDKQARDLLATWLQKHPNDLEARYFRGLASKRMHLPAEALSDLKQVADDPQREVDAVFAVDACVQSAEVCVDLGFWGEALSYADQAIAAGGRGSTVNSWAVKARANLELKRPLDALAAFDAAISLWPSDQTLIEGKGLCLFVLAGQGVKTLDDVIDHYSLAISNAHNPPATYFLYRSISYTRRGDDRAALTDLGEARSRAQRNSHAWMELGKVLYGQAMASWPSSDFTLLNEAKAMFDQALTFAAQPQRAGLWNLLALVSQALGDPKSAVRFAQSSVNRNRRYAQNHQALICAHLGAGEWELAKQSAENWLSSPENEHYRAATTVIRGLKCIAWLCADQHYSSEFRDELSKFSDAMRTLPLFRCTWDWRPSRPAIEKMLGANSLVDDTLRLLLECLSGEEVKGPTVSNRLASLIANSRTMT